MIRKETKIWFRTNNLNKEHGIIKSWLYDTWYLVWNIDLKKYHFVLPNMIELDLVYYNRIWNEKIKNCIDRFNLKNYDN
jgi:hypothetical protein